MDPDKIGQVIRNIMSNAVRFSPESSTIHISLAETELIPCADSGQETRPGLSLVIADQGPGIPYNEIQAVFDEFTQSSKTKDGSGGTGLGLAICQRIINDHQGQITASNGDNQGAVFEFVLPKNRCEQEM